MPKVVQNPNYCQSGFLRFLDFELPNFRHSLYSYVFSSLLAGHPWRRQVKTRQIYLIAFIWSHYQVLLVWREVLWAFLLFWLEDFWKHHRMGNGEAPECEGVNSNCSTLKNSFNCYTMLLGFINGIVDDLDANSSEFWQRFQ